MGLGGLVLVEMIQTLVLSIRGKVLMAARQTPNLKDRVQFLVPLPKPLYRDRKKNEKSLN